MNDIGANLSDLLNKTLGVFIAALVGGFGLMLGLRSAGWKPSPGATVNFFEGRKDDRPQSAEGIRSDEPLHLVPVQSNLDMLMNAIRFDDELLSEHEIQVLRSCIRRALQELCPLAFRITQTDALFESCRKYKACGSCWKGVHNHEI